MKAIRYHRYGSPDELKLEEVKQPVPGVNEVLVKVYASSINSWDWDLLHGKPWLVRIGGMRRPKYPTLGADIAGRVIMSGIDVTKFKPGDEVFGDLSASGWGGFGEYVCVQESVLTLKPHNLSFNEAAAVPQAGLLALQALRDKRKTMLGEKVLINGAAGGVGTFVIQLARLMGAEVTGVDTASKLDFISALGADHVIDYTKEDFTKNAERYDLILDVAAHRSIFDYKRVLTPGGAYVMVGGTMTSIFQAMLLGPLQTGVNIGVLFHKPNKDLGHLKDLLTTGEIKPVIDRTFPLSEVPEAFRYYGGGANVRGKVVIEVASE